MATYTPSVTQPGITVCLICHSLLVLPAYCNCLHLVLTSLPVTGSLLVYLYCALTITRQIFLKRLSLPTVKRGVSKNGWFSRKSSSCLLLHGNKIGWYSGLNLLLTAWWKCVFVPVLCSAASCTVWFQPHASSAGVFWSQSHPVCDWLSWLPDRHFLSRTGTGSWFWDCQADHGHCDWKANHSISDTHNTVERAAKKTRAQCSDLLSIRIWCCLDSNDLVPGVITCTPPSSFRMRCLLESLPTTTSECQVSFLNFHMALSTSDVLTHERE